ncbi:MMPL family transporter [Kineococcus sp. NBC_00420]|uniref:MMPL family transporter n=1 Tax=Kineococcus sp. NBC_00420 TaxID=2903564 RepID=UPI002E1DEF1B
MALVLSRLGGFCSRHHKLVLLVSLLLVVGLGLGAARTGTAYDDEFSIPGSESSTAREVVRDQFPQAGGVSAQIVFQAPEGQTVTDPRYQTAIAASVQAVLDVQQVDGVSDPKKNISHDGAAALATAALPVSRSDLDPDTLTDIEDALDPARGAGLTVEVGGSAYDTTGESAHAAEIAGILLALLILVLTFGSALAAGIPLLTALLGIGITISAVGLLSHTITISSTAPSLALMIGLAVGIDYALFVVSRFRSELATGSGVEEAVARANGTAGTAVVFAGVTVIIALLGLAVVKIPFLSTMGIAGAGAVAIAVLGAVTVLPAVLRLSGERLRPTPRPATRGVRNVTARGEAAKAHRRPRPSWGERWVRWASTHPVRVLSAALLLLGALAVPATQLQLALPTNAMSAEGSTQREAYELIEANFGAGVNGPLLVVADVTTTSDPQGAAVEVRQALAATKGVATVGAPQVSADGSTALIQVVPTTGPSDVATADLVRDVREQEGAIAEATGAQIAVTGTTAVQIDVSDTLSAALVPYAMVVVGLSVILLIAVFRSIAVPLKAAAGFVLSVAAALGATVAVFQWGWLSDLIGVSAVGPIVSFVPIMLLAILFGLAMDYEVFLVSRIREAVAHGTEAREAIGIGARHAARVVVAAGLIMVGVFVAFSLSPNPTLQPIAFSLAVGVLVDAFIVRMTLVPAVLGLLGRHAWWLPRWLDRILPALDIEGEAMTRRPVESEPLPEPV